MVVNANASQSHRRKSGGTFTGPPGGVAPCTGAPFEPPCFWDVVGEEDCPFTWPFCAGFDTSLLMCSFIELDYLCKIGSIEPPPWSVQRNSIPPWSQGRYFARCV